MPMNTMEGYNTLTMVTVRLEHCGWRWRRNATVKSIFFGGEGKGEIGE